MKYELILINGLIKNANDVAYRANIYIKNGKIERIDNETVDIQNAVKTVDLDGLMVLPGMIDAHIHSREPGLTEKEDFYHTTKSAAAGGITTVLDMPNSSPPVHNAGTFRSRAELFETKSFVDFGLWGIALGVENIDSLQELVDEGIVAVKFFWGYALEENTYKLIYNYSKGMKGVIPPPDEGEVFQLFKEMADKNVPLGIHLENNTIISTLISAQKDTSNDYDKFLEVRPNLTEAVSIQTATMFAKETGTHLHVVHISSKEGTEIVRQAIAEGIPVTAETCPQYLYLTNEDYQEIGTMMKVYPPIRKKEDQEALWRGIKDGTISTVGSDHAPHTLEEKQIDNIWEAPAGFAGVQTIFPLMLNAVLENKLSLDRLIETMSLSPAKLFGLHPRKGVIQVGADADFTIIDLNGKSIIRNENLYSKHPISPFHEAELKGSVRMTVVRGNIVAENGRVIGQPKGKLIRRLGSLASPDYVTP
ncbi:allantoinase AllB [Bacillus sp. JJ1773]|uniref:allantoinase AllB n=1 Tax=Bacillus sp. JJ1773 TaxID=3122965 RepID=UPI002FFF6EF4